MQQKLNNSVLKTQHETLGMSHGRKKSEKAVHEHAGDHAA